MVYNDEFYRKSLIYEVEAIHLQYFEPGYTFMASDVAHGRIEKQMRQTRKFYDFRDFVDVIKQAKGAPAVMGFTDFIDWNSGVSQYVLKQLGMNEIVSARFKTGSENIQHRTSFRGSHKKTQISSLTATTRSVKYLEVCIQ